MTMTATAAVTQGARSLGLERSGEGGRAGGGRATHAAQGAARADEMVLIKSYLDKFRLLALFRQNSDSASKMAARCNDYID
jgi:hypothetical protein